MATTKNLCAQIPIALHERVSEERERLGQTTSEYIANLIQEYTVIAVKSGTILIDSSLCREDASTGRLRFTCAHELAHWLLHKRLYSGTGESAAMMTETNIVRTQNSALEMQANLLGSILLMPLPQVKRCFYQLQSGRDRQQLVADMAGIFQVSKQAMRIRLENHHLL